MKFTVKKLGVVTALGIILSAALSFVLMKFAIEPSTGFFYREYHTIGLATGVLIFVIGAVCMLVAALTKKKPTLPPAPCKIFGIASIIMALAVIYESLFTHIGATIPSWQMLLQVSLGLFCAAIFLLNGFAEFGISLVPEVFDIVFILFWLLRVMIVFSNCIPVSTIYENVFELAALCSILVFFLVSAKMRNGVLPKGKNSGALPIAAFTALICTAYSLPQVIIKIMNSSAATNSSGATYISDLACAFYAIAFIIRYYTDRKMPAKPEEDEDGGEETENGESELPPIEM